MKFVFATVAAMWPLLISGSAIAGNAPLVSVSETRQISHGGGCRKSSPPGQCCHAGQKPLHCH